MRDMELTDKDWNLIAPHLPKQRGPGRPRAQDRKTINGILYVLKTGCRWEDMPADYGAHETCRVRLVTWQAKGVWPKILRVLLGQLGKRGRLKLSHGIIDASFAPAKRGALVLATPRKAREPNGRLPSTEMASL